MLWQDWSGLLRLLVRIIVACWISLPRATEARRKERVHEIDAWLKPRLRFHFLSIKGWIQTTYCRTIFGHFLRCASSFEAATKNFGSYGHGTIPSSWSSGPIDFVNGLHLLIWKRQNIVELLSVGCPHTRCFWGMKLRHLPSLISVLSTLVSDFLFLFCFS